jgi:hypothetical protein
MYNMTSFVWRSVFLFASLPIAEMAWAM